MSLLVRPTSAKQLPLQRSALEVFRSRAGVSARWLVQVTGSLVFTAGASRRGLIGCMTALSLVMLSLLAVPLLTGRVPVISDLGWFHIPIRDFYARCLAHGESFDWNPEWFCGFFLVGEGQLGGYHPVHILLYRCLPLDTAFAAEVYCHCPMLLIGMYLFLRRHTAAVGALMGAMLFTFSVSYMGHMQHPNLAGVLAHVPWLLWAMNVAVTSSGPKRKLACAGIGFLTASQILLGHPQAFWFSLLTVAAYAAYLLVHTRPSAAAWAAIVGGNALGFLMGAVQLLASYSAFTDSTRADAGLDYAASFSLHPEAMVGMVAPCLGWGYFGAVPLTLLLWWATARRTHSASPQMVNRSDLASSAPERPVASARAADRFALAALLFALLTLLLAFGEFGGIYYLQTYLPVVGKFRAPARYLTLTQFGVAVASAVAFSRLVTFVSQGEKILWRHLLLPWAAVAVAILVAVCHPAVAQAIPTEGTQNARLHYLGPVFVLAAAAALTLAARGHQLGLLGLVVIAAVDLGMVAVANGYPKRLWHATPVLQDWVAAFRGPPGPCGGRVCSEGFFNSILSLRGYRMASGYAALTPKKLLDYGDVSALRVAGVAWYEANPFRPEVKAHGLGPPVQGPWYRVPSPLPRARLVSAIQVSSSPGDDLKRTDVQTTVLVPRPLELSPGPPGTASITADRPGSICLNAEAPGRQLLVVSESFHSGWRAAVDGKPSEVLRVNGDFMGCVVDKGRHQVELVFRPAAVVYGRLLSLTGLAVGVCICGAVAKRRFLSPQDRKKRAGAPPYVSAA
jgi:hypothetical protein